MKLKEQDLQARIIKRLEKGGHAAINLITASKAGFSDIISCGPTGRFWSIEVKKPGEDEEPTRLQYYRLSQFRKREAVAFWCDSYDSFLVQFNDCTIIETNRNVALID